MQGLRLLVSHAGSTGSIPGRGIKIPHATQHIERVGRGGGRWVSGSGEGLETTYPGLSQVQNGSGEAGTATSMYNSTVTMTTLTQDGGRVTWVPK